MSRKSTIAVLGASKDHRKYGNKCVRAYLDEGWEVFPVNRRESEIEGRKVFARLADVGADRVGAGRVGADRVDLDRVSVYLPPAVTLGLLGEIAAAKAGEVWLNPGSADRAVLDGARELGINAVAACSISSRSRYTSIAIGPRNTNTSNTRSLINGGFFSYQR